MPLVSVILPAYFSDATLGRCLAALRRQSFRDFEAIVVNSSPEERTLVVARAFPEVRFIQSAVRLLPHAARNRAVEQASGELLVFSDPDCVAEPDWLAVLVGAWQSGRAVAGGAIGLTGDGWFERGAHLCKFHAVLKGQSAGPRWILPTANAAYSREAWRKAGPLNGKLFAGDALLSWRARAAGFTPWFEPRAIVAHTQDGDFIGFVRQRFSRGVEFGRLRTGFERWSNTRMALALVATPLLAAWALFRSARDTAASGQFADWLWTFPLQLAGHGSWAAGEARSHWLTLIQRPRAH